MSEEIHADRRADLVSPWVSPVIVLRSSRIDSSKIWLIPAFVLKAQCLSLRDPIRIRVSWFARRNTSDKNARIDDATGSNRVGASGGKSCCRTIDLGSKIEVALSQPVDLVRPDLDLTLPPGDTEIGVMILFVGDRSDSVGECRGIVEIPEATGSSLLAFGYPATQSRVSFSECRHWIDRSDPGAY